ncbi:flagellar basal body-associated protein FliL [Yoonia sp. F2084L]|uniref:flagellar basal body-associated protein FliL n=1 Tax=Yoonia sp. F2084L TaxID=2926419 RepID=UPI001FF2DF5C|nr:flagellar basal body-associated protein FliL [Yoonia sp. F2084L]MCK0095774.1 flagellar basal body-associated protein FliL [Yoonia sp. F2084L]
MKAILIPIVMLLVGVGSGVGAGLLLKPEPDPADIAADVEAGEDPTEPAAPAVEETEEREYAKLNNQFIIPVLEDGKVAALVVMSLNLEVTVGSRTAVFSAEPKLRDRFLQVMFDHANTGGFSGNFTRGTKMRALRNELLRAAEDVIGDRVTDVLVIDIVRQDS